MSLNRRILISILCLLSQVDWLGAQHTEFNEGWRFSKGEIPDAIEADYDDSNWARVTLPHDWSIEGAFSAENPALSRGAWLPAGKGVYRKTFTVSGDSETDKVFIYFDGAYRNSVTYLNGKRVGFRPFGYIGFEYDLTELIDFNQPNVLVVTLDNSEQPGSRWYSGSGLYRDVTLKVRNKVYLPTWGLHVTTPEVGKGRALVDVSFGLKNDFRESKQVRVITRLSKDGVIVATREEDLSLNPLSQVSGNHSLSVQNPMLWSPESPELYELNVQLLEGEKKLGHESMRIGIRKLTFDPEKGFAINGVRTGIRGVCLHHDGGPLGAAVQRRTLERQLETLREMGCNAVRTGHTPFSTEFLDLCDEMGFLVMNDAFDEWEKPRRGPVMQNGARVNVEFKYYAKHFEEWAERDLTDFVLRDRNHPCVILWGIGAKVHSRMREDELQTAQYLTSIVSRLDDRPVMNGILDDTASGAASRIVGELKADKELDGQRRMYPSSAVLVGECFSAQSFYPRGTYLYGDAKQQWWDALGYEYDASFTWADRRGLIADEGIDAWRKVKAANDVMGLFIWAGWDYLGETIPFGWPARSSSFAPIDLCGFPKDGYYFYKSQWTEEPMVHIFPHWNLEGQEGETVTVYAFTNGDEVELFQDGQSLGKQSNDPGRVEYQQWQVVYQPGSLRAVASKGGQVCAEKWVKTCGKPARIKLFSRREQVEANGKDLIYVECSILDSEGNFVPHADNELYFNVIGEASLIAVGNGNPFSHEPFQASKRKAFNGKCLAILQTTKQRGTIQFEVRGEGLSGAELKFEARN